MKRPMMTGFLAGALIGILTGLLLLAGPNEAQVVSGGSGAGMMSIVNQVILGTNGSASGTLGLANGSAGGQTITLQNLSNTAAYNFNLPAVAGSPGNFLASGGGASTSMTWQAGNLLQPSFIFANIANSMTVNGQIGYCSDCTISNPCAGLGTGAFAKRLNGINVCN